MAVLVLTGIKLINFILAFTMLYFVSYLHKHLCAVLGQSPPHRFQEGIQTREDLSAECFQFH